MRCSPFFRTLPAAALASKCAEHERIVRQYGSNHPRAQALEESLSGLERRGSAGRARDGDGPMPDIAFHGFISNEAGEPLPDMTVRVASPRLRTQLAASVAMGN